MFGRNKRANGRDMRPENDQGGNSKYQEALNWEAAHTKVIEKSERKAWRVAGIATAVAAILAVAIIMMMPLKESIPYLVRVNAKTGAPDILTSLKNKAVSYDDVMDKYWLAQYVTARETYDWYTLQKDYDTVGMLSSSKVGATYAALFQGDDALDKRYGSRVKVTVKILSIVPNGHGIGTVRFVKTTKRTDSQGAGSTSRWIATIGYQYRNPSVLRASARLTNPLGFRVTTYRVDPELGVAQ